VKITTIAFSLLALPVLLAAQGPSPADLALASLPPWAAQALSDPLVKGRVVLHLGTNPFFISGDFDGDNRVDVAIAVRAEGSAKRGILFVSRARRPIVLGAGLNSIGNGGDDLSWLDVWRPEELPAGKLLAARSRFVIHVEKLESASAWIYWDGQRFRWHQLGD